MKKTDIDINTSFAVLGLGKFGMSIARELSENDYHVLCCDLKAHLVHEIAEQVTNAVQADVTDASVLANLGIGNYDVAIVGFSSDFESELLTTMILKEMGVPYVLAKATGLRQKKILENVGADMVVMPEIETGIRVAQKLINNDPMEIILSSKSYELLEMEPKPEWIGKSLSVLNLRREHSINVLAVIRDEEIIPDLSPDTTIKAHDKIVALYTR